MHQSLTTLRTVTMYSTKMTFKSFILLTFICYSIGQASALKCYVCASNSDGDCYKYPNQTRYQMDCINVQGIPEMANNNLYSGFGSTVQSALSEFTRTNPVGIFDYKCMTIEGEIGNTNSVVRVCSPKIMTCSHWESTLQDKFGALKIKKCKQCESELCNSSPHLTVGFLSLIGSLLAILWVRI